MKGKFNCPICGGTKFEIFHINHDIWLYCTKCITRISSEDVKEHTDMNIIDDIESDDIDWDSEPDLTIVRDYDFERYR
ncbi:MAG: hypothetical protein ACOC5T_06185 [Elusimicrobiota bacterium]